MATIRIAIDGPAELFMPPAFDPFSGQLERQPGIERLLDGIETLKSRREPIEVEISMPGDAGEPTAARLEAAIGAYCRAEIVDVKRDLALTRRRGLQALQVGLPVLAACLALSAAATALLEADWLVNLISNSFVIAGWVAMWRPAEILLYGWRPARHRIGLLKRLEKAPVVILSR